MERHGPDLHGQGWQHVGRATDKAAKEQEKTKAGIINEAIIFYLSKGKNKVSDINSRLNKL